MSEVTFLCHLEDIPCPGSRGFEHQGLSLFVVRQTGLVRAFVNSCPHTGAELNWQPHQFLDYENELIQCALHMAIFEPDKGRCLAGPCAGKALTPLEIDIREGDVFLVQNTASQPEAIPIWPQ